MEIVAAPAGCLLHVFAKRMNGLTFGISACTLGRLVGHMNGAITWKKVLGILCLETHAVVELVADSTASIKCVGVTGISCLRIAMIKPKLT
jgi:hypothetical protein